MEDLTKIQIPLSTISLSDITLSTKNNHKFVIPKKTKNKDSSSSFKDEKPFKKKPGKKPGKKPKPQTQVKNQVNKALGEFFEQRKRDKILSHVTTKTEYLKVKEKFAEELKYLRITTNEEKEPFASLNSNLIGLTINRGSLFNHYENNTKIMKLVDGVITQSFGSNTSDKLSGNCTEEDKHNFENIKRKIISKKNDNFEGYPDSKVICKTLSQYQK